MFGFGKTEEVNFDAPVSQPATPVKEESATAEDMAAIGSATIPTISDTFGEGPTVMKASPAGGAVASSDVSADEQVSLGDADLAAMADLTAKLADTSVSAPFVSTATAAPEPVKTETVETAVFSTAPAPVAEEASVLSKIGDLMRGVFYLATAEGDQPRVRPFDSGVIYQDKIFIATKKNKSVYNQLKQNPKLEIFAMMEGGGDLRIEAQAVENEDPEVLKAVSESAGKFVSDDTVVFSLVNVVGKLTGRDGVGQEISL